MKLLCQSNYKSKSERYGPHVHILRYIKTDPSTGISVLPWCSLGLLVFFFPLLYHHCFRGINVLDLTLLNSCAHSDCIFLITKMGKAPCNNQLGVFFMGGGRINGPWPAAVRWQVLHPIFGPPPQHPQRGNRRGTRLISMFGSRSFSSYKSETKYFSIICKTSMKVSEDSWGLCPSPWQVSQYNHKWKPSED